jgi:hypothetical protein
MVSHGMGDQNLLSRAPPCFRRHIKPLVPIAFAVQFQGGLTSGRRPVVKIIAESLSQHDKKHVVPTPLSGIRVGKTIRTDLGILEMTEYIHFGKSKICTFIFLPLSH